MLTNALRHGDGSGVEIELHYEAASVSVVARNGVPLTVPTGPPADGGHNADARGLAGLRQRAALFDGTVTYGPQPSGNRWETTATFPIESER
jgi:signal transduction histidine kinase